LPLFFLFLLGALTDLADGYYARKHQIDTILGKLIDPLADKVLVSIALEQVITGLRGVAADAGVVAAGRLGKIKSVLQYVALCVLIFPLGVLPIPFLHELGLVILYVSAFMTVWSGWIILIAFKRCILRTAGDEDCAVCPVFALDSPWQALYIVSL
jgi:CDP-diacylglycerol--glycerol-3-phosphate 3-phosphatidyltransferase